MDISSVPLGAESEDPIELDDRIDITSKDNDSCGEESMPPLKLNENSLSRSLLSITSLALSAQVPHITASEHDGGVRWRWRIAYRPEPLDQVLGSDATCTVALHKISEKVSDSVPAGKTVALKKYREPRYLGEDKRKDQQRLYGHIWQDLRVFTHPYLKDHDNITKLLYLSWEDDSLVPIFAQEFSNHGTLAQFLRQDKPRDFAILNNVSVDVATGIAALHACDFVHGDIKPASVLVYEHHEREVVAKICNFVGTAPNGEFGRHGHIGFGTEEWLAPQVFLNEKDIDWQKADVYSLGLLIAHVFSLLAHKEDCFLATLLEIDQANKVQQLRQAKLNASSDELSGGDNFIADLIDKANTKVLGVMSEKIHNPQSPREGFSEVTDDESSKEVSQLLNLRAILNAALRLDQNLRCTSSELLQLICDSIISKINGRTFYLTSFSPPTSIRNEMANLPRKEQMFGVDLMDLPGFRQRSKQFHKNFVNQMIQYLEADPEIPDHWLSGLDEIEQNNELSVLEWYRGNDAITQTRLSRDMDTWAYWWSLAHCYLLGISVLRNEKRAVDAMVFAARGGAVSAMAMLPILEASCRSFERDQSLNHRMLWALYTMQYDFPESSDLTKIDFPHLYKTMQRIKMGRVLFSTEVQTFLSKDLCLTTTDFYRGIIDEEIKDSGDFVRISSLPGMPHLETNLLHVATGFADKETLTRLLSIAAPTDVNEKDAFGRTPLQLAVACGNIDTVNMLLAHGADAKQNGLLHNTATIADDLACPIAKALLANGAELSLSIEEDPVYNRNRSTLGKGSPLMWAVWKDRPNLFALLLEQHRARKVPIGHSTWSQLICRISLFHHVEMLQTAVKFIQSSQHSLAVQGHFKSLQNAMLGWAVHETSIHHSVACRIQLKSKFYSTQKEFFHYVLSLGADPMKSPYPDQSVYINALSYALLCGDKQAIEIMLNHVEKQGIDPYKILVTEEIEGIKNGFISLVRARCIDGFHWTLQRYPSLIETPLLANGTPFLYVAVILGEAEHVRTLLDYGVDVYHTKLGYGPTAPEIAVENGKLEVAEMLMQGNDAQRLLRAPSNLGQSLFGRLLHRIFDMQGRIKIDTLRWLKKYNALQFFPDAYSKFSIWYYFFSHQFSARREIVDEDLELLDFLLQPDTFLDQIHETDITGQSAIHYVARWANFESVQLLAEKGANLNQDVAWTSDKSLRAPPTATPLQLAGIATSAVPKDVLAGGSYVISLWKKDRQRVLKFIKANGGTRGRYQLLLNQAMAGSKWFDPQQLNYPPFLETLQELDEYQSVWPEKMLAPGSRKVSEIPGSLPTWMLRMTLDGTNWEDTPGADTAQGEAHVPVEEHEKNLTTLFEKRLFDMLKQTEWSTKGLELPEKSAELKQEHDSDDAEDEDQDAESSSQRPPSSTIWTESSAQKVTKLLENTKLKEYMDALLRVMGEHDDSIRNAMQGDQADAIQTLFHDTEKAEASSSGT